MLMPHRPPHSTRLCAPARPDALRRLLLCAFFLLAPGVGVPGTLGALDEPAPAYEKGLYDWTGHEWGLQHHFQAMGLYDDNPRRESYSAHPLPDFGRRFDYGVVLGRYLDRFHYVYFAYDLQAIAWARHSDINTVDHTLDFRWNYFDPQIDVTGLGWFMRPRAVGSVRKAPEDFIANNLPRRLTADVTLPVGYQFAATRLELGPRYHQVRYLDRGFDVLDSRDIGGFGELEWAIRPRHSAWYLRMECRSVDRRRSDLFNHFTVTGLRLGWRQIAATLTTDIGLDADLLTRLSYQARDGTPRSAVNLSPYLDITWQVSPETTALTFTLTRRFEPDTAVSAGALTRADLHLTQIAAPDLLDFGLTSRLTINNRLGGGAATFYSFAADMNFHYSKADWPPLTAIAELGLDLNRSDLPGSSYQARKISLGVRAVF